MMMTGLTNKMETGETKVHTVIKTCDLIFSGIMLVV
jgi:hypothetical protein